MQLKDNSILQGGKYRIIGTLGQGGFGITYEAEQVVLRRRVAIKEFFIKDCCERDKSTGHVTVGTGSQREFVEKFRGKFIREAQLIAGMDHQHIVRVMDVFEENDTAYYVMEYLPGGSLADKVKVKGPLSEVQAKKYIRQIADALAYIHSLNTVHLDVKPSNILLNSKGEAILIDFGISKHYDDEGGQTSTTPAGISKGYAPMEQYQQGNIATFSPATDIYSLGATFYFLLTGETPPEAASVNEDGLPDIKEAVSDSAKNAIAKAMSPKRKDRPQSTQAFKALISTPKKKKPATQSEPHKENKTNESITTEETIITPDIEKEKPQSDSEADLKNAFAAISSIETNRLQPHKRFLHIFIVDILIVVCLWVVAALLAAIKCSGA